MQQFKDLYRHILKYGERKENRTGVDTIGVFGTQMRFDLTKGFPLCTAKFVPFKLVLSELLWFLRGDQDQPGSHDFLLERNNKIWQEWVKEDGSFGPIYGVNWRRWPKADGGHIDQLANAIQTLKDNPHSRRIIVTAWNPDTIAGCALPPCHALFQFNTRVIPVAARQVLVSRDEKLREQYLKAREDQALDDETQHRLLDELNVPKYYLDCQLYQRSCDTFLGVPFNVASYSLLTHMVAYLVGMVPGEFVWTGGDTHIYANHVEQVNQYLANPTHDLPQLHIVKEAKTIDDFTMEHFWLDGYQHEGKIAALVAV